MTFDCRRRRAAFAIFASLTVVAASVARGDSRSEKILKDLKAPAGFDMTVFAAPPEVNYPTCLTATPRGELFVGIDEQGSLGKDAGRGRIVRCIDTDNDGAADQFTTFTKLDHPRGLVWDDAASVLYVLHPPMLERFFDDDRDGVADRSEMLVNELGNAKATRQQGADHTTNGIRLGIDGWIYIAVGDFGVIDGVGADGAHLTLHGGGIVRVRTDGSGLETYASGTRNIYDIAIDPQLNIFTRDNTNDGNAWNDRVTYSPPSAYHGYPSRFRRFPQEIVDCLIDTGPGSPCGSLFVDEPGLPEAYRRALLTVEWGQNRVDRHPLAARGAGFSATTAKMMDVPRGIDIDVDGMSRMYLASWMGGSFRYSDPDVGYVVRLTPKSETTTTTRPVATRATPATAATPATFPDLSHASMAELLRHLASDSGVRRQAAQREIVRWGDSPALADALAKLASASNQPLAGRIAALFTLKLLRGDKADAALVEFCKDDALREFALRALADRRGDSTISPTPFVAALNDRNPRVRLMAAWGVGRLGHAESASAIVPLTADPDPLVAHVAVNALVELNAAEACLAALGDAKFAAGAANALQQMHEPAVVDGLIGRLDQAKEPAERTRIYRALTRLWTREKQWDGQWWQTRPDTTGPYFQPVAWEATDRISEAIRRGLTSESPEMVHQLLVDCAANRVELPEVNERLLAVDPKDSQLAVALLDTMVRRQQLSDTQIAAARKIMQSDEAEPAIRVKTIQVLGWEWAGEAAMEAVADTLAGVGKSSPAELKEAREWFINNPDLARRTGLLSRMATAGPAGRREIALATLTAIAESKLTEPKPRAAAEAALAKLRPAATQPATTRSSESIAAIGLEQSLAVMLKTPGDATRGKELFTKQGCVACHTVSSAELPKGPFLGGISTRYSRKEIVESILTPSAKIAQGFETQWFKVAGGDVIEGFVTRDGGEEIELRDANGKTIVVKKESIKGRGKRDKSVMPEGLIGNLAPADAANLIAYLESLKGN